MDARRDRNVDGRVRSYLAEQGLDDRLERLVPLTPDASDRRYVRAVFPGEPSLVFAVYPESIDYRLLPFSSVSALLSEMAIPVPSVLGHSNPLGIVALEDLGDVTLQAHLEHASQPERGRRYREAVDLIVTLQQRAAGHRRGGCVCFELAFDVEKLTWELNFFVTHFLEAHRGVRLMPRERQVLSEEWRSIAGDLADEPRVLCHRDFHSRNLMLHEDRLRVIDYQDARMGPDTYDLVSLLRDSYVDISDEERSGLIAYFLAASGGRNAGDFTVRFDVMSVQRSLKALGTFGYQSAVKRNDAYLPYIGRTLRYVRAPLTGYPRFERLHQLLASHLPELR